MATESALGAYGSKGMVIGTRVSELTRAVSISVQHCLAHPLRWNDGRRYGGEARKDTCVSGTLC